jgi:hypothetical protein
MYKIYREKMDNFEFMQLTKGYISGLYISRIKTRPVRKKQNFKTI